MHASLRYSFLVAFALQLCFVSARATADGQEEVTLILKPRQTRQVIDGFGASGAWWAQIIGGWPKPKRDRIVSLLYGKEGAALTIYRHNIGAGSGPEIGDPWRRGETFETAAGRYDWSRDAGAVRILEDICAQGVDEVILFANSPPERMTKSGFAFARERSGRSNLRDDMYQEFAVYLLDIAEHFVEEGVPVGAVSPINEPQWGWDKSNQEGCHYEPDEVARLIEILIGKLKQRSLDVRIEAPESGSWERVDEPQSADWKKAPVYLHTLFDNSNIFEHLEGYAIHSYWADLPRKKAFAEYFFARYPSKKLYMTEWCEMKGGRDYGMDSALNLASEIVDDLVTGGVSSWQYWIAVSRYNFRDGLVYVNESDESIVPIKRLWAMGNFSRFIRPGFRRFHAETTSNSLKVVACEDPGTKRIVLVAVNPTSEPVRAKLQISDTTAPRKFAAYETSAKRDLENVTGNVAGDHFTFAAQSVTTLVFE